MATEAMKEMTGMQQYPGFIKPFQENLQRSAEARGEMAGLERSMEADRSIAKQRGLTQAGEKFATDVAQAPQRKQLEQVSTQMAEPFIPTRDNAQTLGTIFALVNIAGFAMGAGGKRNAVNAMSAMNGMLEGYQQGRQDLYKREKDIFDTNIKQLKNRYDMLDRQLKDAIETYKTDKQAGIQKAELAYAEAGANFYKQYADKYGLAAAYEFHKQAYDNANKMWMEKNREEDRAERLNRQVQAEERRAETARQNLELRREVANQNLQLRREMIAMRREGSAESRQKREERDSKLSPVERKEVRGFENLQDEVALLKATFKPEYANFKADAAGDLMAKFKSRFQDDPGMAEWWRRYENVALPERHAMFGATLTGPERDSWRKASIGAGSSTKEVESWIADKERVLAAKLKKYERASQAPSAPAATPSQVRSFNTVQEAEAARLPKGTQIIIGGRRAVVE